MRSTQLFSAALALGAGLVSAEVCNKDITITTTNPSISCDTIDANVIVDPSVSGSLDLEGPSKITGNLIISNATMLLGFSSTTLKSIGGTFELKGLNLLSNLQLENLESVSSIFFEKLTQLNSMTFGTTGVSKADNITITDTRLNSLDGLNIATVANFEVSNNPQLTEMTSNLVNVTQNLIFNTNGDAMVITMNSLESANIVEFRQIQTLNVEALKSVGRLSFITNPLMTSFEAKNLSLVGDSLSFIENTGLTNFSFPALTKIAGDLTIANNTKLEEINGLPKLQSVFGGITLSGAFKSVSMPKLNQVTGSVTASTTSTDKDFCAFFDNLNSDGDIAGSESCTFNDSSSSGGSGGSGSSGSGGSSGGSSGGGSSTDNDDAAGIVSVNTAFLAIAAIVAAVQLF